VSRTGALLVLLSALLVTPLLVQAAASFYLTYKYDQYVYERLSPNVPLVKLNITRFDVESALRPLKGQEFDGDLPVISGEETAVQRGYAFKYYFLHPTLAGCGLYFVFDGPDETSRLVGYRDACE
jgi:hypothetical protein